MQYVSEIRQHVQCNKLPKTKPLEFAISLTQETWAGYVSDGVMPFTSTYFKRKFNQHVARKKETKRTIPRHNIKFLGLPPGCSSPRTYMRTLPPPPPRSNSSYKITLALFTISGQIREKQPMICCSILGALKNTAPVTIIQMEV